MEQKNTQFHLSAQTRIWLSTRSVLQDWNRSGMGRLEQISNKVHSLLHIRLPQQSFSHSLDNPLSSTCLQAGKAVLDRPERHL
ncbi:hypothetical protein D7X12_19385 [Corallococcus sicarius]|uniref:Uncharacterized protein n=1 Tax=Corallococcus sicarius TaxID=2316726 RepID=A0A3A8NNP4_9BACT|nr:hypothetical protein D7X12_19385 [Corallococcus sicarius]